MLGIASATKNAGTLLLSVVANQMPAWIQRGDADEGCWLSIRKVMTT